MTAHGATIENVRRMNYSIEDLTVNINTVNRPAFLEAALQSVIETTPAGASLQIVFNGTPLEVRTRTIEQAAAWDGPTRFVVLEDMLSVDESHSHALASIATPLVNFMGDDDVVLGSRFPAIINAFNTMEPRPAAITTFAKRIAGGADNPTIGSNKDLGPTTIPEWRDFHSTGQAYELLWPGSVLRTELLREIGGFEAPFAQSFDNRIFSQLSLLGPVVSLPERNFGFRIHQGSMSSSNWKAQNEIVRFVAACHGANLAAASEPTFEEFRNSEACAPVAVRLRRQLRDRSRIHFRRGGAQSLSGMRLVGASNMAAAAILWPPAFVEKIKDQIGNRNY